MNYYLDALMLLRYKISHYVESSIVDYWIIAKRCIIINEKTVNSNKYSIAI